MKLQLTPAALQNEIIKISKFAFDRAIGWGDGLPSETDSERTLINVFGAPCYFENFAPLREISASFPHSKIVGCSTAGEIHGATVSDDSLTGAIVKFEDTEISTTFA